MTSAEATKIACERVRSALAEFKKNYPGPYLDRSRAGLLHYALEECVAKMEECSEEVEELANGSSNEH
jgi:hypothetical protein